MPHEAADPVAPPVKVDQVSCDGAYTRVSAVVGPPGVDFVLVPGIGMAANIFDRLAPRLSAIGSVYTLDLPGMAGVPTPPEGHDAVDYARHLDRVLEHYGLRDPLLIGHSMGAQIVVEAAARRHDLTRMVLISPVVAPWHRHPAVLAMKFAQSSLREPFTVVAIAAVSYVLTGARWFFHVLPRMRRYPIDERARSVHADVLIIRGSRDAVTPARWANLLLARFRRSREHVVEGGAHSVVHRYADEVAKACVRHAGLTHEQAQVRHPPSRRPARPLTLRALPARVGALRANMRRDDEAIARAKQARLAAAIEDGDAWLPPITEE